LAWLRARAATAATAVIPIIGPRTPAQLADYLGALDLELSDEQYQRLEHVSAVALGTPHETVAAALSSSMGEGAGRVRRPSVPVI
jgi:diketogulonate reductase-like aldo/keto reductase